MLKVNLRPGNVMAGLVPAIHADKLRKIPLDYSRPGRVDGRDKPGHDGEGRVWD